MLANNESTITDQINPMTKKKQIKLITSDSYVILSWYVSEYIVDRVYIEL